MDPQTAAQLLKGAPTPTGTLTQFQQFMKNFAPPTLGDFQDAVAANVLGSVSPENKAKLLKMGMKTNTTPEKGMNTIMAMIPQILQTVYHGSPYNFSKFDINKVGTGEGAQAYGHGMYLAENPAVAKEYQSMTNRELPSLVSKKALLEHQGKTVPSEITNKISQLQERQGNLYKVDLPDEQIAKMLHWDKPLSDQPAIKKILDSFRDKPFPDNWTGGQAYQSLARNPAIADQASEHLLNNGIPGIKYLDQGSRGAGAGTHNYVVFDPSNLKILGKE